MIAFDGIKMYYEQDVGERPEGWREYGQSEEDSVKGFRDTLGAG